MSKSKLTLSEEQIIAGLRKQDPKAIEYLYDNYSAAVYTVIIKIINTEEIAEEVMQEVFVKIWNTFHLYNTEKGKLFTWMASMARNLAIDKIRSKDFRNQSKNQTIDDVVYSVDKEHQSSFSSDAIGIKELVAKLKPNLKEVVDLIYFKGFTHVEAAEELDLPVGTVKTRLRAAIQLLRLYF